MEFIVDYNNIENIESKPESKLEPITESITEPITDDITDDIDDRQPSTDGQPSTDVQPIKKSKASKKQLESLQKAREKAKESIKRNKKLKDEYLKQQEREESGDLDYLTSKLKHYQDKVNEKMKDLNKYSKKPVKEDVISHKITKLDILLDKLF